MTPIISEIIDFQLVEDEASLRQFREQNERIEWMSFDTEFVGEKRYYTLLCLIQVATEHGLYVIDPLKIKDLGDFLWFISNPDILKITHAGDNDYRILNILFGTLPRNIFDTQIAAGFMSHIYPISFQKLVEKEVGMKIKKGYTVTDWESRPIKKNQLTYALNDVIPLRQMYENITRQLKELGREAWALEEMSELETAEYYQLDIYKEFLNSNMIFDLSVKEQVFFMRLLNWRRREAERKNYSREMILASKLLGVIVKNINEGKGALKDNRRIPDRTLVNHWDNFNEMYHAKVTDEERETLKKIPYSTELTLSQELLLETLHLLIRYRCAETKIAPALVTSKSVLKKIVADSSYHSVELETSWRRDWLGDELLSWVKNCRPLQFHMEGEKCILSPER